MKYKLKPYMIMILILCVLVGIYFLWPIITDETNSVLAEEGVNGNSSISNVAEISNKPIAYITVAVVSPGLYELDSSATVGDVIKLAGVLLPYDDVESINKSKCIRERQKFLIESNYHGKPDFVLHGY